MNDNRTSPTAAGAAPSVRAPFRSLFSSRKENGMTSSVSLELFSTTDSWYVDRERSSIGFRVRQRMIESVWGRFLDFEGMIEPGQSPTFVGSVRVASLATDHPERDELLRSTAFFDAERYPVMGFASTEIGVGDGGSLLVAGDLTIRGITRPVKLE